MTIRQIVADYLRKKGYDGLCSVCTDGVPECGCTLEDLMPCGSPSPDCVPGYRWKAGDFMRRYPEAVGEFDEDETIVARHKP